MAREGRSLEKLTHALETLTQSDPRVTLTSPGRLRDLSSDQSREHDVLMTFTDGHHTVITGFECRDRTTAVGVPDVEAYATKCRRTGVHRPVIVSATGFTNTALETARLENVLLLTLDEIDAIPWLALDSLTIEERAFIQFDAEIPVTEPRALGQPITLLHDDGSLIDHRNLGESLMMGIDNSVVMIGSNRVPVCIDNLHVSGKLADGTLIPVTSLRGWLTFEVSHRRAPVAMHSYGKPGEIGREFASATFSANDQDLRFVMSKREDGRVSAVLMPAEPPTQKAPPKSKKSSPKEQK